MLTWYRTALTKRPLLTQCLSTSFLFAAGDVIAQQAVERESSPPGHNPYRTLRMALYGGCAFGPMVVNWYKFLQTAVRIPASPNLEIVARVALDQAVFTPVHLTLFFSSMAVMEGLMGDDGGKGRGARERVRDKLGDNWLKGIKANWTVWPGVQLVNFRFVPLEHRVLVVNLVSLGGVAFL
ncbi:hypothetical protein L873DRAFT_1804712 [Choiromyces venosus 120613-1]|uniref:Mpv17/PMP22 family protein n=1 Tax=Choiromyces venosus 120613-1 TaxID=1336337 RepID=A0A3N4JTV7_9PEZI|nr:hypothetical protein L873DRAFT_1804712 [Choiromyces venosus 120613-1]